MCFHFTHVRLNKIKPRERMCWSGALYDKPIANEKKNPSCTNVVRVYVYTETKAIIFFCQDRTLYMYVYMYNVYVRAISAFCL